MTITTLKIIALIAMLIDHIGVFIPNIPEWFRWIGRIAIPIFIFAVAVGYKHTSNRKKYILRLYFASFGMAFLVMALNQLDSIATDYHLYNNFFAPLFVMAFVIHIFQKKQPKFIFILFIWQIFAVILCILFAEFLEIPNSNDPIASYYFWGSILGSALFVEGGPLFILLGITLYFARQNKINIFIIYSMFSAIIYGSSYLFGDKLDALYLYVFPFANYQWMMIVSLLFILLYNGKKGKGMKYFFYVFYPAHIVILYFIGLFIRS